LATSKKNLPGKPSNKKGKSIEKRQSEKKTSKKISKAESKKKRPGNRPAKKKPSLVKQEPAATPIGTGAVKAAGTKKSNDLIQALAEYDEAGKRDPAGKEEPDPKALERGDTPMTIVDHLGELRSRVITSLIIFLVLTIAAFVFSDELLSFITKPFTSTGFKLNVFKLTEGFVIRLKVSAIAALLLGVPLLMHQVWRFIMPAIEKKDRMFSRVSLLASVLLFYAGVVFVFFLLVPFSVTMLLSFVAKEWISTIGANDYVNLVFFFCIIMGVLFEMPIILMILTRIGMVTPSFLVSKRKYAIVLAFVISAVITPTQDILTQVIVAVPLIILYEASIIVSKFTAVRKRKRELHG
jgi:sec-independent protein translocase protein TatC